MSRHARSADSYDTHKHTHTHRGGWGGGAGIKHKPVYNVLPRQNPMGDVAVDLIRPEPLVCTDGSPHSRAAGNTRALSCGEGVEGLGWGERGGGGGGGEEAPPTGQRKTADRR